ncbi:MAG: hypothetical protein EHM21_08500 [Chloroflexi bacterium]|nr:MAG: hypothetical protein EHM21_08500 [Chloroflexota bacterium]
MVKTVVSADSQVTAQILLAGAQEILGTEGMRKIIERLSSGAGSPKDMSPGWEEKISLAQAGPFLRELETLYGATGGRGLALRIGRAVFHYGLKHLGEQAGFRKTEFRLLPAPRRLDNGLRTLARIVGDECNSSVAVSDEGTHWLWRMDRRPNDPGPQMGDPCYLIAGLLQEFTAWAGGGRFYRVVETECQAAGCPACVYQIEKKPLD